MDKISYLRLFQIYSNAMTSDTQLGKQLRKIIDLDVIWNNLSDEEQQEMKKIFGEVVNKISRNVLSERNKSLKAFKKGMRRN